MGKEEVAPLGLTKPNAELFSGHVTLWDPDKMQGYCAVHICYSAMGRYNCSCQNVVDAFRHRMANPCALAMPEPCVGTLYDQCPQVCATNFNSAFKYGMAYTSLGQLKMNFGKIVAIPVFFFLRVLTQVLQHG